MHLATVTSANRTYVYLPRPTILAVRHHGARRLDKLPQLLSHRGAPEHVLLPGVSLSALALNSCFSSWSVAVKVLYDIPVPGCTSLECGGILTEVSSLPT